MKHIKELVQKIEDGYYRCEEESWIAFSLTAKEAERLLPHLHHEIEAAEPERIKGISNDEI